MRFWVRYPYEAAIAHARELCRLVKEEFGELFNAISPPSFNDLKKLIYNCNAILVVNERIPAKKEALLIDVEGKKYILLNKRFQRKKEDRKFYLGHELGHLLLKHQSTFVGNLSITNRERDLSGQAAISFSEKPYTKDQALQLLYENEREMDANFFSMMLIAPHRYLDSIVKEHIYISAFSLSEQLNISLSLAVACIELYRNLYGYENSYCAAKMKNKAIDENRVVSKEFPSSSNGLELYLPDICSQLISFIK